MKIRQDKMRLCTVIACCAAFFSWQPFSAVAKDQSKIKGFMEVTGIDPDSSGRIRTSMKDAKSLMKLKFKGLSPATEYTLLVGGIPRAVFITSKSGKGKLKFSNPLTGSALLLDFDPRGKTLSLNDGDDDVLAIVLSGEGEPDGLAVDERTDLAATSFAPGGKAQARFGLKKGRSTFKVEVEDVPPGDYELFVDGLLRGTITVGSAGEGKIEFDSQASPPKVPLDFDPRGKTIDIVQGGNVFFTGPMVAQLSGINTCVPSESELDLTSTGADPDASAKASLEIGDDCEKEFEVEIEDVPEGDYDLLVAGVKRGTITVADNGFEIQGEIEFSSDPDDQGELLLTFDPRDQLIEIKQGDTIFFSSVFAGGSPPPQDCEPEETELPLLNSGEVENAKGKARFRQDADCDQDFRVEIENLPAGDYVLRVNGTSRGTITVAMVEGELQGEIEFDTDPDEPGEQLLDFDPRGQLIEIVQGDTVFLQRMFPN